MRNETKNNHKDQNEQLFENHNVNNNNNKEKANENVPTIMDFIRRMRVENEKKISKVTLHTKNDQNITTDEDITSTQNMINDSRERRKANGKEIKCNVCDYKTGSMALLKAHKKNCQNQSNITLNEFNCDKCDYRATDKTNVQRHIESLHGEIRHDCDKCDFRATEKTTLQRHIESLHEEIRPDCNKCDDENEKSSTNKNQSKRIHCSKCEKRFNKEHTFKSHMKKVHGVDIYNENENQSTNNSIQENYYYTNMTFHDETRSLRSNKRKNSALLPNN